MHASAALYSKATRKALTGKRANKNYYKGKGRSASTPHRPIGRRTKHGNYVIDAPRDAHRLYARTANGEEMWGVHVDGHGNGDDAQMTHVSERYRVRLPEHDRQEDALAQAIFEHQLRVYMPEAYGRAAASRQLKAPVPSPAAGLSELSAAAAAGDLGAVRALLESGADASAVDGDGGGGGEGRTALHHAAAGGHRAVVVELLYSSDPGALDGGARTAAQLAARAGHLDTVRTLLQGGGGGGAAADAGGAGEEGALEVTLRRSKEHGDGWGLRLDRRGVVVGYTTRPTVTLSGAGHEVGGGTELPLTKLVGEPHGDRAAAQQVAMVPAVPQGGWGAAQTEQLRRALEAAAASSSPASPRPQERRPAEEAAVPLGALVMQVDGQPVQPGGREEVLAALRSKPAAEPELTLRLSTLPAWRSQLSATLQRLDLHDLRYFASAVGVPEREVAIALHAIWERKPEALRQRGGTSGREWRAPEYVVPDTGGEPSLS